jgi:hypothetical protein
MINTRKIIHIKRMKQDDTDDTELTTKTPEERISMMWQIAQDAWTFMGEDIAKSRLQRYAICILRPES